MKTISFVLHGKLRQHHHLIAQINNTFQEEYQVVFYFTQHQGHAITLARQAAASQSEYVIATGGDGTLNEVVNGVLLSENKSVITGLLPCGTGNDFAKTIQVSNRLNDLKKLITNQQVLEADAGFIQYQNENNETQSRYFINICDVGIGGSIAKKLAGSNRWLGAFLTFQKAIISTFLTYKHSVVKSKADDFIYEGKILSYIIANGKYFGGGMGIAPDALPDNGEFEIVLGADISLTDYLKNFFTIRQCQKVIHPQMKYFQAKNIAIESATPLPIDMDGEFIGYTPLTAKIAPKALRLLSPLAGSVSRT